MIKETIYNAQPDVAARKAEADSYDTWLADTSRAMSATTAAADQAQARKIDAAASRAAAKSGYRNAKPDDGGSLVWLLAAGAGLAAFWFLGKD